MKEGLMDKDKKTQKFQFNKRIFSIDMEDKEQDYHHKDNLRHFQEETKTEIDRLY